MTIKTYDNLPSSAINQIVIDTDNNTVTVQYKSSGNPTPSGYEYSVEDATAFDTQFLAEFDSEDFSVGAFINEKVNGGVMSATGNYPEFLVESAPAGVIDESIYPAWFLNI